MVKDLSGRTGYLERFGQKFDFLGQKTQCSVFLGGGMHYYMVYIAMKWQIRAEPKHVSQISN